MDMQNVPTPEVNQEFPKPKFGLFAIIGVVLIALAGGIYYFGFSGANDAPPSLRPAQAGYQGFIKAGKTGFMQYSQEDITKFKKPTTDITETQLKANDVNILYSATEKTFEDILGRVGPQEGKQIFIASYEPKDTAFLATEQTYYGTEGIKIYSADQLKDAKVKAGQVIILVSNSALSVYGMESTKTAPAQSFDFCTQGVKGWNNGIVKNTINEVTEKCLPSVSSIWIQTGEPATYEKIYAAGGDTAKLKEPMKNYYAVWVKFTEDPKIVVPKQPDVQAPTVSITSPTAGQVIDTKTTPIKFSWTGTPGATVTQYKADKGVDPTLSYTWDIKDSEGKSIIKWLGNFAGETITTKEEDDKCSLNLYRASKTDATKFEQSTATNTGVGANFMSWTCGYTTLPQSLVDKLAAGKSYTFSVTANDGALTSSPATVTFTTKAAPGQPAANVKPEITKIVFPTDNAEVALDPSKPFKFSWEAKDDTVLQFKTDKGTDPSLSYEWNIKDGNTTKWVLDMKYDGPVVGDVENNACNLQLYKALATDATKFDKLATGRDWTCPSVTIPQQNLEPGKTYTFTVRAFDGALTSDDKTVTFKTAKKEVATQTPPANVKPTLTITTPDQQYLDVPADPDKTITFDWTAGEDKTIWQYTKDGMAVLNYEFRIIDTGSDKTLWTSTDNKTLATGFGNDQCTEILSKKDYTSKPDQWVCQHVAIPMTKFVAGGEYGFLVKAYDGQEYSTEQSIDFFMNAAAQQPKQEQPKVINKVVPTNFKITPWDAPGADKTYIVSWDTDPNATGYEFTYKSEGKTFMDGFQTAVGKGGTYTFKESDGDGVYYMIDLKDQMVYGLRSVYADGGKSDYAEFKFAPSGQTIGADGAVVATSPVDITIKNNWTDTSNDTMVSPGEDELKIKHWDIKANQDITITGLKLKDTKDSQGKDEDISYLKMDPFIQYLANGNDSYPSFKDGYTDTVAPSGLKLKKDTAGLLSIYASISDYVQVKNNTVHKISIVGITFKDASGQEQTKTFDENYAAHDITILQSDIVKLEKIPSNELADFGSTVLYYLKGEYNKYGDPDLSDVIKYNEDKYNKNIDNISPLYTNDFNNPYGTNSQDIHDLFRLTLNRGITIKDIAIKAYDQKFTEDPASTKNESYKDFWSIGIAINKNWFSSHFPAYFNNGYNPNVDAGAGTGEQAIMSTYGANEIEKYQLDQNNKLDSTNSSNAAYTGSDFANPAVVPMGQNTLTIATRAKETAKGKEHKFCVTSITFTNIEGKTLTQQFYDPYNDAVGKLSDKIYYSPYCGSTWKKVDAKGEDLGNRLQLNIDAWFNTWQHNGFKSCTLNNTGSVPFHNCNADFFGNISAPDYEYMNSLFSPTLDSLFDSILHIF